MLHSVEHGKSFRTSGPEMKQTVSVEMGIVSSKHPKSGNVMYATLYHFLIKYYKKDSKPDFQ